MRRAVVRQVALLLARSACGPFSATMSAGRVLGCRRGSLACGEHADGVGQTERDEHAEMIRSVSPSSEAAWAGDS